MPLGTLNGVQIPARQSGKDALYRGNRTRPKTFLFAEGDKQGETLDFVAQSIIVDNLSNLYVYLPDCGRWALPNVAGQIFPTGGVSTIRLVWSAPPGIAQGSDNGAPVVAVWCEEPFLAAAPQPNSKVAALSNYEQAVPATPSSGLLSVGPGPWDGGSAGHYAGPSGAYLAINGPQQTGVQPIVVQSGGQTMFEVDSNGIVQGKYFTNVGNTESYIDISSSTSVRVQSRDTAATPLQVVETPAQTADAFEVLSSALATLMGVRADGLVFATLSGAATKQKAGAPVDGDWGTAPPDGTIVVDSTNNKLWARVGGVWKGAALA